MVVQLIRMHQQAGHEDYRHLNMDAVQERARLLADTDEAAIPNGLAEVLEEDAGEDETLGVDKAATPAERLRSEADVTKNMNRARPSYMVPQRDSDARNMSRPAVLPH